METGASVHERCNNHIQYGKIAARRRQEVVDGCLVEKMFLHWSNVQMFEVSGAKVPGGKKREPISLVNVQSNDNSDVLRTMVSLH